MLTPEVPGGEQDFEAFISLDLVQHPFEVPVMVCLNEKSSAGLKDFVTRIQKRLLEKTFLMMPSFRPWIGEEVEYRLHLIFGEHELESFPSCAQIAEVSVFQFIEFLGEGKTSLKAVVETNEIYVREFLAVLQHEFTVACADFDLDRFIVLKKIAPLTDVHLGFLVSKDEGIEDLEFVVVRIIVSVFEIRAIAEVIVDGLLQFFGSHNRGK